MNEATSLSTLFEESVAVGVIILLFVILLFLIKKMMETNDSFHKELEQKDGQLIETIKEFNDTVLKINDSHDRNLQFLTESNKRIEDKVDKIFDKVLSDNRSIIEVNK